MVKIYGSENCGNCTIINKKVEDKGIEFEYVTSEEELIKNNIRGLPTLVIDGKSYNYYQGIRYINSK